LNPEGKKQYDRNFMLKLQYEPSSMTRPANLPALPDIILNEVDCHCLSVAFVLAQPTTRFTAIIQVSLC